MTECQPTAQIARHQIKVCRICGEAKAATEFSPSQQHRDGLLSKCKRCHAASMRRLRSKNLDSFKAKENAYRAANRDRINARKKLDYAKHKVKILAKQKQHRDEHPDKIKVQKAVDYQKHKELRMAKAKQWAADHPESNLKRTQNYRRRNPEKYRAYAIVNAAKRRGRIVVPQFCVRCGKRSKVHAHHVDYSKPLIVAWLCPACHVAVHRDADSASLRSVRCTEPPLVA